MVDSSHTTVSLAGWQITLPKLNISQNECPRTVMVQPCFPSSVCLCPPPSMSTCLHLCPSTSIHVHLLSTTTPKCTCSVLAQLHCTYCWTNFGSRPNLSRPSSHAKGHHPYALFPICPICLILVH